MLIYTNRANMKESKFLERVRTAIVKFVVTVVLVLSTVSISAERTNIMITINSENTLTYVNLSLNVSSATDSSLPYLHEKLLFNSHIL